MLAEWLLALHCVERGIVEKVYPVVIGSRAQNSHDTASRVQPTLSAPVGAAAGGGGDGDEAPCGDFFAEGFIEKLPELVPTCTHALVERLLRVHGETDSFAEFVLI